MTKAQRGNAATKMYQRRGLATFSITSRGQAAF
jgi:hypothetical protein